MIQWMLAILSLVPLPFLNPVWTSGSSQFTYCWSLARRILSITFLACEIWVQLCGSLNILWHCLSLVGMKTDLFQSRSHFWVFQICWHIERSILTASSFRIWSSLAGIPSTPLTLFVVMFPKAHLTSHSRMSVSRRVITPLWLSGSLWSLLYSYFVYSWRKEWQTTSAFLPWEPDEQ